MNDTELSLMLADKLNVKLKPVQIKHWRRYRHLHCGRTGQFGERNPAIYAKREYTTVRLLSGKKGTFHITTWKTELYA